MAPRRVNVEKSNVELLSSRPSRAISHSCIAVVDREYLEHTRKDFDLKQLLERKKESLCCNQRHFPGFLTALPRADSVVNVAGSIFLIVQMFGLIVTFLWLRDCR